VDDHDYGINDGDKKWKYKEDAKQLLISYFDQVKAVVHRALYNASVTS
jgi:hypothetical protein